jgi:crossover junction endodeoxyribonuclease RusA
VNSWTIEHSGLVWTMNAERRMNVWRRAQLTREWRAAYKMLAIAQKVPKLEWARVVVQPYQKNGRLQDVGACFPTAKAAIDGVVDAGVLADDSAQYLVGLEFLAPLRGSGKLVLTFIGEPKTKDGCFAA